MFKRKIDTKSSKWGRLVEAARSTGRWGAVAGTFAKDATPHVYVEPMPIGAERFDAKGTGLHGWELGDTVCLETKPVFGLFHLAARNVEAKEVVAFYENWAKDRPSDKWWDTAIAFSNGDNESGPDLGWFPLSEFYERGHFHLGQPVMFHDLRPMEVSALRHYALRGTNAKQRPKLLAKWELETSYLTKIKDEWAPKK